MDGGGIGRFGGGEYILIVAAGREAVLGEIHALESRHHPRLHRVAVGLDREHVAFRREKVRRTPPAAALEPDRIEGFVNQMEVVDALRRHAVDGTRMQNAPADDQGHVELPRAPAEEIADHVRRAAIGDIRRSEPRLRRGQRELWGFGALAVRSGIVSGNVMGGVVVSGGVVSGGFVSGVVVSGGLVSGRCVSGGWVPGVVGQILRRDGADVLRNPVALRTAGSNGSRSLGPRRFESNQTLGTARLATPTRLPAPRVSNRKA